MKNSHPHLDDAHYDFGSQKRRRIQESDDSSDDLGGDFVTNRSSAVARRRIPADDDSSSDSEFDGSRDGSTPKVLSRPGLVRRKTKATPAMADSSNEEDAKPAPKETNDADDDSPPQLLSRPGLVGRKTKATHAIVDSSDEEDAKPAREETDDENDFDFEINIESFTYEWQRKATRSVEKSFPYFEEYTKSEALAVTDDLSGTTFSDGTSMSEGDWKILFPENTINQVICKFFLYELFDRPRTKAKATVLFKLLTPAYDHAIKTYPTLAAEGDYDAQRMSKSEGRKKFRASAAFKTTQRMLKECFGASGSECTRAAGLFKQDIDRMLLSVGIGVYGMRTEAYLTCVGEVEHGPRPLSW
jgi:hypothetical protein